MDLNIQFLVHSNYKNCSNSDHFSESLSESDTGSPLLTSAIRWHLEAPRASQLSPSLHLLLDRVPVRVPLVTREKRNVVLRPLCIVCMSKHYLNDPKIPRSPRSQVSSFNLL